MDDDKGKALKVKEKKEVTSAAEQTKQGPTFTPEVDIFETDQELTVVADMPGVKANALDIDLRENILTLAGEVQSPEGSDEVDVYREYRSGSYFRKFTLSEVIDQPKINAELRDGVLRLTLPKIAPATPRKISVKTA